MSWRAKILGQFTSEANRVTIVTDPDKLLLDEQVAEELRSLALGVITYADPIPFRFEYESKYRSRWDRGEATDESVIIRVDFDDYSLLPYDLLRAGRHVSLSLATLFPWLSYRVIASLERGYLDALHAWHEPHKSGTLGENESKDFILSHVFGINPELITTLSDLLIVLLRIHYRNLNLPRIILSRLIDLLNRNDIFQAWPLERILSDRYAFFDFIQERWPIFLKRTYGRGADGATDIATAEGAIDSYNFRLPGPADLPFEHPEVRVYLDNLFSEGLLKQVEFSQDPPLLDSWVAAGIKTDPDENRRQRMDRLFKIIEESLPGEAARHRDWMSFARRWAELSALNYEGHNAGQDEYAATRRRQLQASIDHAFTEWVGKRYSGLHNQASLRPVMLHHVPRVLARRREQRPDCKIALVVIDGLALDQWIILRDELAQQRPHFAFREEEIFAWVPTLTSVSRQAAFAGQPPIYFQDSLHTTVKEPTLWKRFWGEYGLMPSAVAYAKVVGDTIDISTIEDTLSHPQVRVAGIVIAKIDRIMHGEQLGMKGMHNHVRLWAKGGFMAELLDRLISLGFDVCITADHGNIQATGIGSPAEGALAGYRGERVRVFSDPTLRQRVRENYVDAVEWSNIGLPETYFALLAPVRASFVTQGEERIVHGGIAIEELIVPLIYVTQKE